MLNTQFNTMYNWASTTPLDKHFVGLHPQHWPLAQVHTNSNTYPITDHYLSRYVQQIKLNPPVYTKVVKNIASAF